MDQETKVATEAAEARQTSRRTMPLAGGLAAAGAVIGITVTGLLRDGGDPSTSLLEAVPPDALGEIQPTLAPASASMMIDEARRCHEPLARVVIMQGAGSAGGVISIRSGGYQSPTFALTPTPTLVGLPYPAAYQTGQGTLVLEGEAKGLVIGLTPRQVISFTGSWVIPVHWTPVSACR